MSEAQRVLEALKISAHRVFEILGIKLDLILEVLPSNKKILDRNLGNKSSHYF